MKLIAFHKVLIACAVAFCLCYGVWELYRYFLPIDDSAATIVSAGDSSLLGLTDAPADSLWTGLAMLAGAAAMGAYLVWVFRFYARRNQTA